MNDRALANVLTQSAVAQLWRQAFLYQLLVRKFQTQAGAYGRPWCHGCGSPLALNAECMSCLRARHGPFFSERNGYRG